jgi:arginase family enzyme
MFNINLLHMTEQENRSKNHSLINVEAFAEDAINISDFFTTKFDYVVKKNMYKPHNETLAIYDFFRQIMIDKNNQIKTPIITLSPDTAISGSTIAGATEKFMYTETNPATGQPVFKSNLKVIYIDASPDLSTKLYTHYDDFMNSILADALGFTQTSFSAQRVHLSPANVYVIGYDEDILPNEYDQLIRDNKIRAFSYQLMRTKGVEKIMKYIVEECKHDDVHVVMDLSCVNIQSAPSVYRNDDQKNGFDFDQMKLIANSLKSLKCLNGVDITGYNFGNINDKDTHYVANMLTIKLIEMVVTTFINLKQKSINVFDENSKFLIWRRIDSPDHIGWLILRGMSLAQREDIIAQIDSDDIITVPIDDEQTGEHYDAYVSVTTLKEQNEKSYYTAQSFADCCLFPGDKLNMMFELVNVSSQQLNPMTQKTNDDTSDCQDTQKTNDDTSDCHNNQKTNDDTSDCHNNQKTNDDTSDCHNVQDIYDVQNICQTGHLNHSFIDQIDDQSDDSIDENVDECIENYTDEHRYNKHANHRSNN